MTDAIDRFNAHLLDSMKAAQHRLEEFHVKLSDTSAHVEKAIHNQIKALEDSAEKGQVSVAAAQAEMSAWVRDSASAVGEWKAQHDKARLHDRAERTERYAKAASELAIAALEAAERASLEARIARQEAKHAKGA